MSLSGRTKNVLRQALADNQAASDLINNISSDAPSQSLGATDSPTFAALTLTSNVTVGGDVKIASGHVVKVNNVQVLGAQQTAVTPVAVTFSANAPATYASPTGALTISDGATPTVVELVKYCNELRGNIVALQAVLHTHGITT